MQSTTCRQNRRTQSCHPTAAHFGVQSVLTRHWRDPFIGAKSWSLLCGRCKWRPERHWTKHRKRKKKKKKKKKKQATSPTPSPTAPRARSHHQKPPPSRTDTLPDCFLFVRIFQRWGNKKRMREQMTSSHFSLSPKPCNSLSTLFLFIFLLFLSFLMKEPRSARTKEKQLSDPMRQPKSPKRASGPF